MLIIISEICFHCYLPLFPFILHPLKSLYHIVTFTRTWFSLGVYQLWQCFSNFTAYWNCLGIFKTILMPGIPSRDPDWIILGWSQVIPTRSLLEWWLLMLCMYSKCGHQVSYFDFSLDNFLSSLEIHIIRVTPAFSLVKLDFSPCQIIILALFKTLDI